MLKLVGFIVITGFAAIGVRATIVELSNCRHDAEQFRKQTAATR